MELIEVLVESKENYFKENYSKMFPNTPELTDEKFCIHCHQVITVGDYKVFKDNVMEYICCPNSPECDGTVIDWMDVGSHKINRR